MGKIYKITNIITNKVYIGQTIRKYLSTRWLGHVDMARRNSPTKLYKSMNKHGYNNFRIDLVEETDNNLLSEREVFWINYYNSYKNGYNSNLGGAKQESKLVGLEDTVVKMFALKNISEISKELEISRTTIRKFLKSINIYTEGGKVNSKSFENYCVKPTSVSQFTKEGKYLKDFSSMKSAIRELKLHDKAAAHISKCCQNKKPSAYGYIWKYK